MIGFGSFGFFAATFVAAVRAVAGLEVLSVKVADGLADAPILLVTLVRGAALVAVNLFVASLIGFVRGSFAAKVVALGRVIGAREERVDVEVTEPVFVVDFVAAGDLGVAAGLVRAVLVIDVAGFGLGAAVVVVFAVAGFNVEVVIFDARLDLLVVVEGTVFRPFTGFLSIVDAEVLAPTPAGRALSIFDLDCKVPALVLVVAVVVFEGAGRAVVDLVVGVAGFVADFVTVKGFFGVGFDVLVLGGSFLGAVFEGSAFTGLCGFVSVAIGDIETDGISVGTGAASGVGIGSN